MRPVGRVMWLQGASWIAVETPNKRGLYPCRRLPGDGRWTAADAFGNAILGDGGPIAIPPDNRVTIATDGTVSVVLLFGTPNNSNPVGRIKLVNPPENDLARGPDGLFRLKSGQPADADPNVRVVPKRSKAAM